MQNLDDVLLCCAGTMGVWMVIISSLLVKQGTDVTAGANEEEDNDGDGYEIEEAPFFYRMESHSRDCLLVFQTCYTRTSSLWLRF